MDPDRRVTMKPLGYGEITRQAERSIIAFMDEARRNANDFETAQQFADWAFGIYLLWDDLIPACSKKEKDRERLIALTNDKRVDAV